MTKEELAKMLNEREYLNEMTAKEEVEAKVNNLVVVFGYSDDNIEFRGAISEEISMWQEKTIKINHEGLVLNQCDEDDCPYFDKLYRSTKNYITVKFNDKAKENEYFWTIQTNLPFASFDIKNDGELFCKGIVFDIL
jgi:hypothetical protein